MKAPTLLLWMFTLACSVRPMSAQQPLDEMISTVGTTAVDSQGRHWAYLVWQSPTLSVIKDQRIAIYSKAGAPDSALPYQRVAITGIQTDPAIIAPLLDRAAKLGHPPGPLEERIDALFGSVVPDSTVSLPEKLSAVIRGSLSDPNHCENLLMLSRQHAAIAFCLGLAHAELISGPAGVKTTFELRIYDAVGQADVAAMGRVAVTAGQPLTLPAPGQPRESVDVSPQGDLNVKLLWSTPAPLRRLSLANDGFNIYRVQAQYAEQQGFHLVPPTIKALRNAVQQGQHAFLLNRTPVLASEQLDDVQALQLSSNPTNYFFSDSNNRANPELGPPQELFYNGAEFYYFVTARDVLGRDGLVSRGTRVTVCDRMPPPPPLDVRVENAYAYDPNTQTSERRLKVIWTQNQDSPPERTTGYFIHRWTSLQEMHDQSKIPLAGRIAGPIPHLANSKENEFVDTTPFAPHQGFGVGKTYWYTVRAGDAGACVPGSNVSGNSSPAFGVIRDFAGPDGGGGRIVIRCVQPSVRFVSPALPGPDTAVDVGGHDYRLVCTRTSQAVEWVEFLWQPQGAVGPAKLVARRHFGRGASEIQLNARWSLAEFGAASPRVTCRIGLENGKIAESAMNLGLPAQAALLITARFEAGATTLETEGGKDCETHDPVPPENEDTGEIDPVIVELFPPDGAEEWRLYRRVDQAPMTLIDQGDGAFEQGDSFTVPDRGLPANAAELCYFVQYFDQHGNGGPLHSLGCIRSEGTLDLPVPVLSAIQPLGTSDAPLMEIQWACAPHGVERFEVWVGGSPVPPPANLSPDLLPTDAAPPGLLLGDEGPHPAFAYQRYFTRRIGPGFGQGPAFSITANCLIGNHWRIFVRALGSSGAAGRPSNVETFTWTATNPAASKVAWPARPLPPASKGAFGGVLARVITTNLTPSNPWEGLAIRIGVVTTGITAPSAPGQSDAYLGHSDPVNHLYRSATDEPILDVVLYRWQVENDIYPQVSGDVIQVSPMIESVAWQKSTLAGSGAAATLIRDPFIRLFPESPPPPGDPTARGIYLLDTQPVLEGARYRYSLVRFSRPAHEPIEVINTDSVEVP